MLKKYYLRFTVYSKQFTQFAFTLAETLIVMGIIGVVAALTIPSLTNQTSDKQKVAKVKKVYSILCDAMGRAIGTYGEFEDWFPANISNKDATKMLCSRLASSMKKIKYKNENEYCEIVLADGIKVTPNVFYDENNEDPISIGVFLDEKKIKEGKEPILGKDWFQFNVDNKGDVYPYIGDTKSQNTFTTEDVFKNTCLKKSSGGDYICGTFWIINYGNMDYLKLDDDGKCPDGKQLSTKVTQCD